MDQALDELVLGSVTLVNYVNRIEIFLNDVPGLVKPYTYFRVPDLRMSLLSKVSSKGTETFLTVGYANNTMNVSHTVEFNLGEKFETTELLIAGIRAKLNEFMGAVCRDGFGYGGAQFSQPGYAQNAYTTPNEPQQNHTQWNGNQQGWN